MPRGEGPDTAVLRQRARTAAGIVNYRVNGDTRVIDWLFTSAELVSGTGKHAQRVSIYRTAGEAIVEKARPRQRKNR
jgi:hypothetical protein